MNGAPAGRSSSSAASVCLASLATAGTIGPIAPASPAGLIPKPSGGAPGCGITFSASVSPRQGPPSCADARRRRDRRARGGGDRAPMARAQPSVYAQIETIDTSTTPASAALNFATSRVGFENSRFRIPIVAM